MIYVAQDLCINILIVQHPIQETRLTAVYRAGNTYTWYVHMLRKYAGLPPGGNMSNYYQYCRKSRTDQDDICP